MAFNLSTLMIDESVSKAGTWVDYLGGSRLKIGSTQSQTYKNKLSKLVREHRLEIDNTNPDAMKKIQELTAQAMAEDVLLDWEGIDFPGPDGTTIPNAPYTVERGKLALMGADAFREFVAEKAGTPTLFKAALIEEAVGN